MKATEEIKKLNTDFNLISEALEDARKKKHAFRNACMDATGLKMGELYWCKSKGKHMRVSWEEVPF